MKTNQLKNKLMKNQTLTIENAKIGLTIKSSQSPEWGCFTLSKDEHGWIKNGRSGSNHIFEHEFKYWEVV